MPITDADHPAIRALDDELVDLALHRAPGDVIVSRAASRLREAGVRLDEIRMAARTLHPAVDAIGASWTVERGIDTDVFLHRDSGSEAWLQSPLYFMVTTLTPRLHRRIADPDECTGFPAFAEMAAEGYTDYLAHLVGFGRPGSGRREGLIFRWLSRQPEGFRDADLALLDRVAPRAGAAVLPGLERSIARNLMDAYVGRRSGAQVLEGTIRPGDGEALDAVILVVDLSGFTAASDAVPGDRLVDLLDRHFEAMVPPVTTRGGEILAFLGDGFLAAFELDSDPKAACRSALDAAVAAIDGVETIAPALAEAGLPALKLEAALHIGTVRYGNVGAGGRQAFTVIGPAVNAATRIEALCRPLGHRLLASQAFAAASGDPRLTAVGEHPIRGVVKPMTLYALA